MNRFIHGLITKLPSRELTWTNISPKNGILKMIFLFPRWDMLVPWRVTIALFFLNDPWKIHPTTPILFKIEEMDPTEADPEFSGVSWDALETPAVRILFVEHVEPLERTKIICPPWNEASEWKPLRIGGWKKILSFCWFWPIFRGFNC